MGAYQFTSGSLYGLPPNSSWLCMAGTIILSFIGVNPDLIGLSPDLAPCMPRLPPEIVVFHYYFEVREAAALIQ